MSFFLPDRNLISENSWHCSSLSHDKQINKRFLILMSRLFKKCWSMDVSRIQCLTSIGQIHFLVIKCKYMLKLNLITLPDYSWSSRPQFTAFRFWVWNELQISFRIWQRALLQVFAIVTLIYYIKRSSK